VRVDEAYEVVTAFLAARDGRWELWSPSGEGDVLSGTPVLYVPCEDEFEEQGVLGGLVILVEVEDPTQHGGLEYVVVSTARENTDLRAEQVGDSMRITLTEPM
jgi:hypothetical protein